MGDSVRPTVPPEEVSWRLIVSIRGKREVYPLPSHGEVTIGRAPECDIKIAQRSVSRKHLKLITMGAPQVQDLGSSNGTVIIRGGGGNTGGLTTGLGMHDQKLIPGQVEALNPEDILRIGPVTLLLEPEPAATPNITLAGSHGPVLLSPQMKNAYDLALRAAVTDIPILILGETGVGKEVLAELVHKHSPRANRPFLRLNCAALSPSLLESELFGYERGAFTGAVRDKAGLLESSNGGTVFLDEIGELPLSVQVTLLRVLENGTVMRVGATSSKKIDVRFITATHRDLNLQIAQGGFRKDFFFRICGFKVTLPPLRQRQEEIHPLAEFFLSQAASRADVRTPRLSPTARERLEQHSWPGNVRELRNAMERALVLSRGRDVEPEHITGLDDFAPADDGTETWMNYKVADFLGRPPEPEASDSERLRILSVLEECGGNQTRAAKALGISRRTLINRLDSYQIARPRKTT